MLSERTHAWSLRVAVAFLLTLHAVLALTAVRDKGLSYDEIFHVTGGYLFDRDGDFRIHPDNGVLPQRVHGLAPLLAGANPPTTDSVHFRQSDQGVVGHDFFFIRNTDYRDWLFGARSLNLTFSLALCFAVFAWARALGGERAGLVALTLAVLSPTLLAHGPLATSDMASAFFLTVSAWAFSRQLTARGPRPLALSVICFGAACVSKYSAVVLIPVFLGLSAWHVFNVRSEWKRVLIGLSAHAVGAWAMIWLMFGFRFAAGAEGLPPVEHFLRTWVWIDERLGWQAPLIAQLRTWKILPEGFLFGYAHTYVGSLSRPAFLAGEYSDTGWRLFFPLAFFWKSTVAELLALVLTIGAAAFAWRAWRTRLAAWAPIVLLAGGYALLAVTSKLNIGHRHLLPLYPLLFIATGVAVAQLGAWRTRVAAIGLVGLQLVATATAYPNYLAYFNSLAGGSVNGWRLLVDSSLDWGQELPALRRWLDANDARGEMPVFISYFGSDQPEAHGIKATRLPFTTSAKFRQRWYEPRAGLYCVSATMLQQPYGPVRGKWTLESESLFRRLRLLEPAFRAAGEKDGRIADEELYGLWETYDKLRFARLCFYLRARQPDGAINHAIFVFRLSEAELDRALRQDAKAWAEAVEGAARR